MFFVTCPHFPFSHFIRAALTCLADDDSNSLTLPCEPPISVKTTWTLLLYLTSAAEGCIGGETVFYPHDRKSKAKEIVVPPETGMLLLHKHGDDCLLVSSPTLSVVVSCLLTTSHLKKKGRRLLIPVQHEGREVVAGEKWVLRTDLCIKK